MVSQGGRESFSRIVVFVGRAAVSEKDSRPLPHLPSTTPFVPQGVPPDLSLRWRFGGASPHSPPLSPRCNCAWNGAAGASGIGRAESPWTRGSFPSRGPWESRPTSPARSGPIRARSRSGPRAAASTTASTLRSPRRWTAICWSNWRRPTRYPNRSACASRCASSCRSTKACLWTRRTIACSCAVRRAIACACSLPKIASSTSPTKWSSWTCSRTCCSFPRGRNSASRRNWSPREAAAKSTGRPSAK